jgi:hypothetical protein
LSFRTRQHTILIGIGLWKSLQQLFQSLIGLRMDVHTLAAKQDRP